ncbi:MAG: hypothetical protein EA402_06780 [Planctomycetota bacterium]|nr:MAG: hypothetical protein EA402_06780 [Planctomycetota bacterium]
MSARVKPSASNSRRRPPPCLLLDVQNCLHGIGELQRIAGSNVEAARRQLYQACARFPEVWYFLDGGPAGDELQAPGHTWVRSGCVTADEALVDWLQRHPQRRPVLTISADRDLGMRARGLGSRIMEPVDFWRRYIVTAAPQAPPPVVEQHRELNPCEVDHWLRMFESRRDEPSDP